MITTDQNLRDKQNLDARQIAIVILKTTWWLSIQVAVDTIVEAIEKPRHS